jgi:hypothetical protein
MEQVHRSVFTKAVKEAFPELQQDMNQQHSRPGSLVSEMEVFRKFVQQLINDGDRDRLAKAYGLAEWGYKDGNKEMKAAIDTCFLEELDFDDTSQCQRRWALERLPPTLAKVHGDWLAMLRGRK